MDPSPLQVDHLPVGPRPRVLDPRLRDDADRGDPPQHPLAGRHLISSRRVYTLQPSLSLQGCNHHLYLCMSGERCIKAQTHPRSPPMTSSSSFCPPPPRLRLQTSTREDDFGHVATLHQIGYALAALHTLPGPAASPGSPPVAVAVDLLGHLARPPAAAEAMKGEVSFGFIISSVL